MNEQIRAYMDKIFSDVPKTRKNWELKEELIGNLQERYQDLLSEGMPDEVAYESAVESLGDVNELLRSLQEEQKSRMGMADTNRKKQALLNTIAVGLYIFGVVVFFAVASTSVRGEYGIIAMLTIFIIPICLNVYAANAFPKYNREDDTVVEEFQEWKSGKGRNKAVQRAASSIVWSLTLIVYFLISFTTMSWHISWIIFLIGGCVDQIVKLIFSMKE